MTDKAKLRDSVKKNVRALLISAPMGLSMRELERDYVQVICDQIPALELGFNSAQDLLLDMPDVANPRWERGNLVLFGVADSTTKHIQKLVSRQRKDKAKIQKKRAALNRRVPYVRDSRYSYQPPRKKQPSSSSSFSFSRSFRAPEVKALVPASLQSQIKVILKKHPAGISNEEFQSIFYQYENYNINFRKLGFQSLWELLRAIPGVKASHTSKDEYDIFIVSETVQAIPAGYEDSQGGYDVNETDYYHKGQRRPNVSKTVQAIPAGYEDSHDYYHKGQRRPNVSETVQAIPAGYEDSQGGYDVNETDYYHKGQRRPNVRREVKSSSARPKETRKEPLPPRLSGNRMAPTNSRSPWALAGVPQPTKKVPVPRGRGKTRDEPPPDDNSSQKRSWTAEKTPTEDYDDTPLPVEQYVEAPFEKQFVDDISKILAKHPNGLWSIELPDEYKKLTGKPLKVFEMGYFSVVELVSSMPNVVTVVREDTSDWKLYDARKRENEESRIDPSFQDEESSADEESTLEDVKEKLRGLLEDFEEGILLEDLQTAYERKYTRNLPLKRLGFHDVDSLILLIPDVVKVVYRGHGKVYAFSERETHGIAKYDSKMAILCSLPQDAVGYGYKYRDSQMPPLDQYFEVYVSSVCTPHKLTIQVRDKEQNLALEELMDDLEAIYKYPEGERYFFPTSMIAVNQLCCALYLEDNNWHRAIITGVIDNDFVEVNYVDYGSTLQVPKSCLRLLKACFLKVPAVALDAKLANVEPLQDKWYAASRDRLLELTSEKPLIAYCTEIKNKVLSLFLCDTTTENDIHINDLMVQEEYARFSVPKTPQTPNEGQEGTLDTPSDFDPSDFVTTIEQIPVVDQLPDGHPSAGGDVPLQYPTEIYPADVDPTEVESEQDMCPTDVDPTEREFNQVTEAGDGKEDVEEVQQRDEEEEEEEILIAQMNQELEEIGGESESDSEDMEEIEENNLNLEDILLTMRFLEGRRKRLLAVLSSDEGVNAVDDLDETETLIRHFEERKKKVGQTKITEKIIISPNPAEFLPIEPSRSPQLQIEEPSPNSETIRNSGEVTPSFRTEEHDFPILEQEEQSIPEQLPLKPVVDPATLKDLGQMLRTSLKISAEPFRPKQMAAISPFRRPPAQLPTSPSAFLDNTDTMQNADTDQGSYPADSVIEQELSNPPYDQMVDIQSKQGLYQAFQPQEQYMAPQYMELVEGQEYLTGMGRDMSMLQHSLPGNLQLNSQYEVPLQDNPMTDPRLIQGGTTRFTGAGKGANVAPAMGSQMVRHQGVQQFYSGLDMSRPKPMQLSMRNPGPPMIRGMRVPGPPNVLRFPGPSSMPAYHFNGPSNFNSMAFPPLGLGNIPNQAQHGLGGMNNMYSTPPPFIVGNRIFRPNLMGRGMERGNLN